VVKRPARLHERAAQNQFHCGKRGGRLAALAGPGPSSSSAALPGPETGVFGV
jgi:hypothetical protein